MKREHVSLTSGTNHAYEHARRYGLGIAVTEFRDPAKLQSTEKKTLSALKASYEGSRIDAVFGPMNEMYPRALSRELLYPMLQKLAERRTEQTIDAAVSLGAKLVVCSSYYDPYIFSEQDYRIWAVETWSTIAANSPENVVICLMNVKRDVPQILLDVIRQVNNPRLKLCLNVPGKKISLQNYVSETAAICLTGDKIRENDFEAIQQALPNALYIMDDFQESWME